MTRFFNRRQHNRLYADAGGKCTNCATDLSQGWHADHVVPWAEGGPTTRRNGQALCAACNLKKGKSLKFEDTFMPRRFQRELMTATLARISTQEAVTIANVAPGSGKTLAWQAIGTELLRRDLIDFVAVYVPRSVLARQAEVDWRTESRKVDVGNFELFDARHRLEQVRHRRNVSPLVPKGVVTDYAFATTYASLVFDAELHLNWAQDHANRFLLVADEAQFCGDSDKEGEEFGGTKAGFYIEQMAQYALHTMLLTGTPYRSDGKKLILTDYREDERGKLHPITHAQARYRDGIARDPEQVKRGEGYLRQFESSHTDYHVTLTKADDSDQVEEDVSSPELRRYVESLKPILDKPEVWQPVIDETILRLRSTKRVNPSYRALVSCMEQKHARKAAEYIRTKYPDLSVELAVSEDGPAAEIALRDFKSQPRDVLVTVRKAFIGYDCPEITVVGILTNYRDIGHLMQLVGRGLRVWKEKASGHAGHLQRCHIVTLDDPEMQKFITYLKKEQDAGLAERGEGNGGGDAPERRDREWVVEDVYATTTRSESLDRAVPPDDYSLYAAALNQLGPVDTPGKVAELLHLFAMPTPVATDSSSVTSPRTATPKTEDEKVKEYKGRASGLIGSHLVERGHTPDMPSYKAVRKTVTFQINSSFGITSTSAITTADEARRYASHVMDWVQQRRGL